MMMFHIKTPLQCDGTQKCVQNIVCVGVQICDSKKKKVICKNKSPENGKKYKNNRKCIDRVIVRMVQLSAYIYKMGESIALTR